MARVKSRGGRGTGRRIVAALVAAVAVIGGLAYWKRRGLAVWYMEGNKKVQEMVILVMLEQARPIIERELKMTLPEKILAGLASRRNESERKTDALEDVRRFGEMSFANRWLRFLAVHRSSAKNGFPLRGFGYALAWRRGQADEILAAFNLDILKRKIGAMEINRACGFFVDLKAYVEKKAKRD